ncbi:hypothetical protein D3C87_1339560 [compost metagenome]
MAMDATTLAFGDGLAFDLEPVGAKIFDQEIKRAPVARSVPRHTLSSTGKVGRCLQFQGQTVHVPGTAEGVSDPFDECSGLLGGAPFHDSEYLYREAHRRKNAWVVADIVWHRAKRRDQFSQPIQLVCDGVLRM